MEKYIFSEVYTLFLKYKDMKGSDEEWEELMKEENLLRDKYRKVPLIREMLIAINDQIAYIVNHSDEYEEHQKIINITMREI